MASALFFGNFGLIFYGIYIPIDTCGYYLSLHFVLSCQCAGAFFQLKQNILLELTEVTFNKLLYDILRFILSI